MVDATTGNAQKTKLGQFRLKGVPRQEIHKDLALPPLAPGSVKQSRNLVKISQTEPKLTLLDQYNQYKQLALSTSYRSDNEKETGQGVPLQSLVSYTYSSLS